MKWEYIAVRIDEDGYYVDESGDWRPMSELGRRGWELVSVAFQNASEAHAFFKREKSGITKE